MLRCGTNCVNVSVILKGMKFKFEDGGTWSSMWCPDGVEVAIEPAKSQSGQSWQAALMQVLGF